jgi:hypothetical protein
VPIADAAYSSVLVLLLAPLTVQHVLLMMTRVKILAKDSLLVKIHQLTTDTSGDAALNVGLRSYRRGISPEFGISIPATNVIL